MAEDSVDAILEQWRRERPDLDPTPIGIVGRIARAHALLDRQVERLFEREGLTGAEYDLLATLRRAGTPFRLSPTELSRSMMLSQGGTTKRLNGLEARGFVRRDPDPNDRRGSPVSLTAAGRRVVDRVVVKHIANERELLAGLSRDEQEALAGLLRRLLSELEER